MNLFINKSNSDQEEAVQLLEKSSFLDWFKEMFIFFWITSLIGHYWEVIWAIFKHSFLGEPYWGPTNITIVPIAAPYGLGVIVIIWFIIPLIKKYHLNPVFICLLNVIVAGAVEYICAAVLTLIFGRNLFWDYSNEPFNLSGFICLRNTVAFGLLSTLYVYRLHPILLNFLKRLTKKNYDVLFWAIFLSYAIDLTYAGIK